MLKLYYIIIIFLSYEFIYSQNALPFGFERNQDIYVIRQTNDTLSFPWIGGLNAVHFHEIDLNLDNSMDLILFDKVGNRLLPFINLNNSNQFSYRYAPEYIQYFPKDLRSWIILYDYNNDGKNDLFTYYPGGIRLFKNTSDSTLSFILVSNMLNSLQFNNYINIYVTDDDYPAIVDIDYDGDVDILVFYILGNYVELHQNMAFELFGNPDTLVFHRTRRCWGYFVESDNSNELSLNVPCPFQQLYVNDNINSKQPFHVGSTLFVHDVNNDSLPDLLLGDTDYPNLILLINGGSIDSAHIISQDIYFPSNTTPVNLYSMPVVSFVDIDNDSIKEILVSVFSSALELNESKQSIFLYKNQNHNNNWNLEYIKSNFLQSETIDFGNGAYPVIIDYNGDGLADLLVANYGNRDSSWYENGFLHSSFKSSIALFLNIGSNYEPVFKLIDENFANLSSLELRSKYPAFADLDSDGDLDMVVGHRGGTLYLFENIAGQGNPMSFQLNSPNWLGINVGQYSTPVFFDLTQNGLPDLVIGNRNGTLHFYENIGGPSNPNFILRTTNLGGINTADLSYSYFGFSTPTFYLYQNELFLLTGSNRGWLLLYNNILGNLDGNFTLVDTLFTVDNFYQKFKILEGIRTSVALHDFDSDGFPELIVGNYCGGLSYFKGTEPPPDYVSIQLPLNQYHTINLYPNPANNFINFDINTFFTKTILQIYHITGRLIIQKQYENMSSFSVDISSLSSGIYIAKLNVFPYNYHQSITFVKYFIKY